MSDQPQVRELEARLARCRAVPEADLRARVVGAAAGELAASRRRGWWNFAAALAAVVLIGLNLSLSAARRSNLSDRAREPVDVAAAAERVRQAVPELSADEIRRELILLSAGSRLVLCDSPKRPAALSETDLTN